MDSLVESSARIGLLVDTYNGSVRRSLFRANVIPIALERSALEIAESNVYEGNEDNRLSYDQGFKPAPSPILPPPPAF